MSRRFKAARLEIGLLLAGLVLWWLFPQLTWQPLIVCAAAAAVLAAARWLFEAGSVLPETSQELALGIWLASAGVGVWAAYDRQAGLRYLALTICGLLLFYVIASFSHEELWQAAGYMGGLSSLLVLFFLLTNDWQWMLADLPLINRLGLALMEIRPEISWQRFHPNMVAGVLAAFFPIVLALSLRSYRRMRYRQLAGALASLAVMSFGLFMTSSRAAWAILAAGLGLWWLMSRRQADWLLINRPWLIASGAGLLAVLAVLGLFLASRAGFSISDEAGSLGTRFELFQNALYLAQDVLWLGGGLGSFAGLFSRYVLQVHVPIYFYSHNLYLDILIEQGLAGLLAWLGILASAVGLLLAVWKQGSRPDRRLHSLVLPVLAGLVILALHGLVDNPFYETWSRPLIFLLPGMGAAVVLQEGVRLPWLQGAFPKLALVSLAGLVVFGLVFSPVRSSWLANVGAVAMARAQLAGWPEAELDPANVESSLAMVKPVFRQALLLNPDNFTARYRQGLIAYQKQDFPVAVAELQASEQLRPTHPGVRKMLGLALTWVGEEQQALERLAGIPDMVEEMSYYTWWWGEQKRPDLSRRAGQIAEILAANQKP